MQASKVTVASKLSKQVKKQAIFGALVEVLVLFRLSSLLAWRVRRTVGAGRGVDGMDGGRRSSRSFRLTTVFAVFPIQSTEQ